MSGYKPKLYVAGKFADGSYVNKHIEKLEALGYTITHNWTKVEDSKEHTTDELAKYAAADIDGVVAADYLIVIITDPTYPYRGSCSELGAALALKKKVFVLYDLPKESTGYYSNIFAKHALVSKFSSMSDLIAALEQYCAQCHESLGEGYACANCDEQICRTCVLSGTIQLEEWLDVSNHCSKCAKLLCYDCVLGCYTCANYGADFVTYCEKCAPEDLEYIQCKYHRWSVCNKHPDKKCGTCYANRNYHQKHFI